MKKLFFILVIISIVIFVGCEEKEQTLTDIINNKITFITEDGESIYLKDYKSSKYTELDIVPNKYAIIDLNGDNVDELVLHTSPDFGLYLVFHKEGKNIYSFEFVEREIIDLKADGTFIQSEGAGINYYVKLTFNDNKYKINEEAYVNTVDNIYRKNGIEISDETVEEYVTNFNNKDSIEWTIIDNG